MNLITTNVNLLLKIILECKQFCVCVCFIMRVNELQGQSLENIDTDLCIDIFIYRWFSVMLSQVMTVDELTSCISRGKSRNAGPGF